MAKFKLDLLTRIVDRKKHNFDSYYLTSPITDFLNISSTKSNHEPHYAFSFDEKLALHANAQKELTFSIVEKLFRDNEWIDNPYAHNIHVGSQILLTDKYNHEYLFTVSKISFKVQELNIIYQYTCQDTFSYQGINQNKGYTIENDLESIDFIGAKTLDFWSKKIIKECYNTYELLDTHHGLYLDEDGNIEEFIDEQLNAPSLITYQNLNHVKKIIKPLYVDDYFQQLFTFSCSGSNAIAALISLGEKLDCVIKTYEHSYKDDQSRLHFKHYIWFEPKRHLQPTGLKYTPRVDLQSFNFSLNGNNLATVLNITPTHFGDEIISVFPKLPAFFQTWFQKGDWESSQYTYHMFSQKLSGIKKEKQGTTELFTINGINYYGIRLNDQDITNITEEYPIISFNQEKNYSIIGDIRSNEQTYCLFLPYYSDDKKTQKYLIVKDGNHIPAWWFAELNDTSINIKNLPFYIGIHSNDTSLLGQQIHLFLSYTREKDEDELLFAQIADQCPWLENKLIDLQYPLSQKLISEDEFMDINNYLNNEIRVINGKLMSYSQSYYLELHKSTKIVTQYTTQVDRIGAIMNHLIRDYAEKATVNQDILNDFNIAYSELFNLRLANNTEPISLINRNQLISDYFNRTFNADQRFFKSIKNFRDYFESHDNFTNNADTASLTNYLLTTEYNRNPITENHHQYYYSFQASDFKTIYDIKDQKASLNPIVSNVDADNSMVDLYTRYKNEFRLLPIPNRDTFDKFYKIKQPELIEVSQSAQYDDNLLYFITKDNYHTIFPKKEITSDRLIMEDKVELTTSEVESVILYKRPDEYYIRKTNVYTPFNWLRYPIDENPFQPLINTYYQGKMPVPHFLENQTLTDTDYAHNYASSFPLDKIYFYGKKMKIQADTNNKKEFIYYNEFNYSTDQWNKRKEAFLKDYPEATAQEVQNHCGTQPEDTNLFQSIPFLSNMPVAIQNLNNLQIDDYFTNIESLTDSFKYYGACNNTGATGIANNTGIAAVITAALWWIPGIRWGAAALTLALLTTSGIYSALASNKDQIEWLNHYLPNYLIEPHLRKDNDRIIIEPTGGSTTEWKPYNFNDYYDSTNAIFGRTAESFAEIEKNTFAATEVNTNPWSLKEGFLPMEYKEYFNYYGLVVATYSFGYTDPLHTKGPLKGKLIEAYKEGTDLPNGENYYLWVKNNTYSHILTKNDSIYKYDKYYMIILDKGTSVDASKWSLFTNKKQPKFLPTTNTEILLNDPSAELKFSNLEYWWLPKILLDLTVIPDKTWDEANNLIKLEDFLTTAVSVADTQNTVFTQTISDQTWTFMIVHDEPYETVKIAQKTQHCDWNHYSLSYEDWHGEQLYDINHQPIQLLKEPLPDNIFYTLDNKTTNYEKITIEDLDNTDIQLFYLDQSIATYRKTYTMKQIQESVQNFNNAEIQKQTNLLPLYFRNNQSLLQTYLEKNRKKFLVNLYAHHVQYDDQNINIIKHEKEPLYNQELDFTNGLNINFKTTENDKYATMITLGMDLQDPITNLSNGEIWYNYHNTRISPSLVEQANMIEVQLEQAWQSAVTASKMGNYFLPDSWKPAEDNHSNIWANQLWLFLNPNEKSSLQHIGLSYNLLPQIYIYSTKYKDKHTEILPNYEFLYKDGNIEASSSTTTDDPLFMDNPAFQQHLALNRVKDSDSWNDWNLVEKGTRTYYYLADERQGISWNKLLSETLLSSSNQKPKTIYENFDGWYPMMYKVFRTFDQAAKPEFLTLQEEKLQMWTALYKAYPNIFLEREYTNADATTSQELLQTAKLAFNDQIKPEEAYNLTVLDIANIKGYQGQELDLGDSIQLDTESLYTNFDDIYNSLNKFLFITDISYDLRKDTDIQLTVNTIKYQEKLLQQLVKLIR